MIQIITNILRGIKKRIFQYFGISFLLITIISTITGLYENGYRVKVAFYEVAENSGTYDYRINLKNLNNYIDSEKSLQQLKMIIKNQFVKINEPKPGEQATINGQIDQITITNIQNNTLPQGDIDSKLQDYLLNWGANYKAIIVDYLINEASKNDDNPFHSYHTEKSFLKNFSFTEKSKKLFYSFEDAFFWGELPVTPQSPNSRFDFSPFRDGFNQIYITNGRKPTNDNEVVINPKFAKTNGIKLGSQQEFIPGETMIVTGFGYSYWGITGERTIDNINPRPEQTTQVFTSQNWLRNYLKQQTRILSKTSVPFFLKIKNNDDFYANRLEAILSTVFNFNYGSVVIANENDIRGGAVESNFKMQDILFSSISCVILIVAIFIVLSYVRKEIDLQKKQIGLIKSLGYTNWEISIGFTTIIFLVTFLSAGIGYGLGFLLQMQFNSLTKFGWYLPIPFLSFNWVLLLLSLVIVPLILTLSSYWQSIASLQRSPLSLVYDRPSNTSSNWIAILKKPFYYWGFKSRVAVAFALKSLGKLAIIFFTFLLSSFLLIFQIVATDVISSKIDHLYSYVNSDVYSQSNTISMYNFDQKGKITGDAIYSWVNDYDLSNLHEIVTDDFHFDSNDKTKHMEDLIKNLKSTYMNSENVNNLYRIINSKEGNRFIDPTGEGKFTPQHINSEIIISFLNQFYNNFAQEAAIDPLVTPFPGISIGQNIFSNQEYPTLNFSVTSPASWTNHSTGPLQAKKISVTGIYNKIEPTNSTSLAWKDWFNFKELKNRDLDSIFYSGHALATEKVSYIDNFGRKIENQDAYIIPTAISQPLASLNHYKVNDEALGLINANNIFIPVVFKIEGIITTNLDSSDFYTNLDDLKHSLGYVDSHEKLIPDVYNKVFSKQKNPILNNYIDIASTNSYDAESLKNNMTSINQSPIIFSLIKSFFNKLFVSFKNVLLITQWITIIALAFVLIIIINMILDNNILIIAMMKSLGYRINEINTLIIGSYIVTLLIAFFLGTMFAYFAWYFIIGLIVAKSTIVLILPVRIMTILSGFGLVFLVLLIGYSVGLYFIKYKPVTKLLQSE